MQYGSERPATLADTHDAVPERVDCDGRGSNACRAHLPANRVQDLRDQRRQRWSIDFPGAVFGRFRMILRARFETVNSLARG